MTELLHRLLTECETSGEAIEVHRDRLTSSNTVVGIVVAWSQWVVILEVVDNGVRDGVTAIRTDDITRVKRNSRQLRAERATAGRAIHQFSDTSTLAMTSALTAFEAIHHVVECVDESGSELMSWIGRSTELDDDFVQLDALAPPSRLDRCHWLLATESITTINAGSRSIANLLRMYEGVESTNPGKAT
jgi:hypothetical protein